MDKKYRFTFSITFDNSNNDNGYSFNYVVRLFENSEITVEDAGVILNLTLQECLNKEQELINNYQ
jgi:hypothetical protein